MLLYADEDFAFPAVEELRVRGHDVLTAQEDGQTAMPDAVFLARAIALGRVVFTHNRRHCVRLHLRGAAHVGILTASQDSDHLALASRIGCSADTIRNCPRRSGVLHTLIDPA